MNIKSLLLGSAAAAVAFTGAKAADAIVIAEPEPMEYVRICDAYGAGYFYIPGTETCLRISGWARYQIDAGTSSSRITVIEDGDTYETIRFGGNWNLNSTAAPKTLTPAQLDAIEAALPDDATFAEEVAAYAAAYGIFAPKTKGWSKTAGAQVNFDARSETEYGTLRGWIQLEGTAADRNESSPDIPIYINRAVIQLGGLWMGYADSLFSTSSNIAGGSTAGNYAGTPSWADKAIAYHYEQRNQIGYQFNGGNGFWGGIALEHDGNEDYMPDVVGKVAFSQGWGAVWAAAGYDESADGVGVRGGIQGNFAPLTVRLDAYYQSNAAVSYGRKARWAIQGAMAYQINPSLAVYGGLEYRNRLATNAAVADLMLDAVFGGETGHTGMYFSSSHAYAANIGVNWQPVKDFLIGADVTHNRERYRLMDESGDVGLRVSQDSTTFRLRFQRNF